MRLEHKVAVVTGAATGIGQAIAVRFAQEGACVVVDYVGKPDAADETKQKILGFGGKVIAVEADVSNLEQVQNLIASAVKESAGLTSWLTTQAWKRKCRSSITLWRNCRKF